MRKLLSKFNLISKIRVGQIFISIFYLLINVNRNLGTLFKKLTTRPKERIRNPLKCMKSVSVRPSTGESSSDAKSVT